MNEEALNSRTWSDSALTCGNITTTIAGTTAIYADYSTPLINRFPLVSSNSDGIWIAYKDAKKEFLENILEGKIGLNSLVDIDLIEEFEIKEFKRKGNKTTIECEKTFDLDYSEKLQSKRGLIIEFFEVETESVSQNINCANQIILTGGAYNLNSTNVSGSYIWTYTNC